MYSTTAAIKNGQRGRTCTCDPSVPSRVRWLLRYALFAPMDFRDRGREKRDAETLGIGLAVRFEIGASGGTCTHTLPADNGLLFYSATEAEMVGSAGNAPVVTSGFI